MCQIQSITNNNQKVIYIGIQMMQSRREFLNTSAALAVVINTDPGHVFMQKSDLSEPWHRKMNRCVQHNLNEHDPVMLDVNEWVNYWSDIMIDTIVLTAGGFIAMYPTKLSDHYRSQFLGDRDLFGEYTEACRRKGIRVVARIETNWGNEQILKSRPEWFERNTDGTPRSHIETPWVYRTCLFSNYRHEQMPLIIREISSLYDVDGFFTNSWPHTGRPYLCSCDNCKKLGPLTGKELSETFMKRILEICNILNKTVKEKRKDCIYNINIGGSINAVQNLMKISNLAEWITTDHQGRSGNTPVWDCAQQGRVAYAVMKGKPVTNVVGTKTGPWRHSTNSEPEINLWLAQTTSSGMKPWLVWMGSELPDKRWREIGKKYYQWLARNQRHFINKRSLARLGVVFSQKLVELYDAPGSIPSGYGTVAGARGDKGSSTDYLHGIYYALLEGRFLFDLVHEDDIEPESLKNYSAIILQNIALLSNRQIEAIIGYVKNRGSLLLTFETGLYNEWGERRTEFPFSGLLDVALNPEYTSPSGQIFYMSIDGNHEIVEGFGNTNRIPGGEYYTPMAASGSNILSVIPPYPNGIPEMVYAYPRKEMNYPGTSGTNPGMIVREKGQSRLVYFPTDIDRCSWVYGSKDLSELLQKSIRWMLKGNSPVKVEGMGNIEIFAWETEAGFALHILNYTNPNMTKPSMRNYYPIGEQKIMMEIPEGATINKIELLKNNKEVPFKQKGNILEFTIPGIIDFEVVALYKK